MREIMHAIGDPSRVTQLVIPYLDMIVIEEMVRNPVDPANMDRLLKVAKSLERMLKEDPSVMALITQTLQALGANIGEDAIKEAFALVSIVSKLKWIPDILVATGVGAWSGSFAYSYKVRGLDTDSSD